MNIQFANILCVNLYPDHLYPLFDKISIDKMIKSITDKFVGVKYINGKFEISEFLNYIRNYEEQLIKQKQFINTDNEFVTQFYNQQLKVVFNNSGLLNAIFIHKIVAPISIEQYIQELSSIMTTEELNILKYTFELYDNGAYNTDLYSEKQINEYST